MKLNAKDAKDLIAVLNAQSGVAKIADKDEYKAKLDRVGKFLNTKDGKAVGGVTKEVYDANKDNKELVDAAKAHQTKAKERAAKTKDAPAAKAPAAKKAAKAAPAKESKEAAPKQRTPEQEAETAKAYVAYAKAVTTKAKTGKDSLSKEEFAKVEIATRKHRAPEGGLKPDAYKRFGGFPGVKEAAKEMKALKKDGPTMG